MGKRSNSKSLVKNNTSEEISSELVNREIDHPVKSKKKKLKHNIEEGKDIAKNIEDVVSNTDCTKSKAKEAKKTKKAKDELNIKPDMNQPKKIIFENDVPQTIELGEPSGSKTKKKKNKVNNVINEESLVNDKDIDNFCDELTDQDNEQYEEWVQLLEAKLHPNKKS